MPEQRVFDVLLVLTLAVATVCAAPSSHYGAVLHPGAMRPQSRVGLRHMRRQHASRQWARLQSAGRSSTGPGFDYEAWSALLQQYVKPGVLQGIEDNLVDYPGIAADPRLAQVLESMATAPAPTTKNETYALFMNAYNLFAINMYVRHPCFLNKSTSTCEAYHNIWDIGNVTNSVWNMPAGHVSGVEYSLEDIEDMLRAPPAPWREDVRVHACIVCASISCPPTRREAFRPDIVDAQMDDQVRAMLANPKKGSLVDMQGAGQVTLSKIFLWYAGDFAKATGSVLSFVSGFLAPDEAAFVKSHEAALGSHLMYFPYDWDRDGTAPVCTPADCAP